MTCTGIAKGLAPIQARASFHGWTMRVSSTILVMLLVLVPASARAQEAADELPALVQDLFLAETVYAQGAGELQLTVDARFADAGTARLLAEYGITDRLQVSAATPYLQLEQGGEETMAAGVLYNLVNGRALAASVSLEAVIPTGGASSEVEWEPALIVARQVGTAQLHGSVGAGISREQTELSPALGLMLDAGRITPTLELTATLADGESPEVALTPGLFVHVSPHVEMGLGAPLDVHHASVPDAMAMVTLEF
jgi:hypothetical protein